MARVVVVTGASLGIGVRIAEDLARDGGTLVLVARDQAGLEATAAKVRTAGAQAVVVAADLTVDADRERVLAAADAAGGADVLVNNAGLEIPVAVLDQTPVDVTRQIELNLTAPILLARVFAAGMVGRGRGAIVMISSMSAKSPVPWNSIYAATKYGLNGFTSSFRIELIGTGVHAGVVCPGFISETGMWAHTGLAAPSTLPEVSPAAVVAGVRAVIGGKGEVLVTRGPIRPLLALAELFPAVVTPVLRWMGILDTLRARAVVTARERASG